MTYPGQFQVKANCLEDLLRFKLSLIHNRNFARYEIVLEELNRKEHGCPSMFYQILFTSVNQLQASRLYYECISRVYKTQYYTTVTASDSAFGGKFIIMDYNSDVNIAWTPPNPDKEGQ